MGLHNTSISNILLSPPLERPLRLRLGQGRFGAKRSTHVATGASIVELGRAHDGVDLHAKLNAKVFPAVSGLVVDARGEAEGREPGDGRVSVFHHLPGGPGYLTKYLHLQKVDVARDQFVEIGDSLGTVGVPESKSWEPHLHFELRHIVSEDMSGLSTDELEKRLTRDSHSMPVDPTRGLYHWELEEYDNKENGDLTFTDRKNIRAVSEIVRQHIRYFRVELDGDDKDFLVPHYQPSADEVSLVESLRQAHMQNRAIVIGWRVSEFWENEIIISQVRIF